MLTLEDSGHCNMIHPVADAGSGARGDGPATVRRTLRLRAEIRRTNPHANVLNCRLRRYCGTHTSRN
jgi:hypothetical protein